MFGFEYYHPLLNHSLTSNLNIIVWNLKGENSIRCRNKEYFIKKYVSNLQQNKSDKITTIQFLPYKTRENINKIYISLEILWKLSGLPNIELLLRVKQTFNSFAGNSPQVIWNLMFDEVSSLTPFYRVVVVHQRKFGLWHKFVKTPRLSLS